MNKTPLKRFVSALLALSLFGGPIPAASAFDFKDGSKLAVRQDFLYYNNRITGSRPSGSFLTEGSHVTNNLGLLYNVKKRDTSWEGALDGRATDDERIEAKRLNLKRFYLKADNDKLSAVAGDYFASFSQYTLNTSLKGGRYTQKIGGPADLTILAGAAKPNWDDLWTHKQSETVDRMFYGLRASKRFEDDAALGASVVWSKDSRSRFNTSATTQNQRIAGLDWSLPTFRKLRLYGESAFSKTENDYPTAADNSRKGWAHLVKADYSFRRFKTANEFERVSTEFATTGGAASPDLIRVRTQNKVSFAEVWRWIANYTWFHNNLNRAAGESTSVTRMPETGLRYEGPDWRPNLSAEAKVRHREVTSSSTGRRSRTRSALTSFADRFGPVNLNLDYELQHEDRSDGTASGLHHILGIGASSVHQLKPGWRLMPSLRYNLQRDRDNLIGKTDQTGLVAGTLALASPWGLDAGAGYSRNLVLNAVDPGSDRRSASASLGYNILKKPEHRVTLRFRQNDNRFGTSGQDFKETILEAGLTNRF